MRQGLVQFFSTGHGSNITRFYGMDIPALIRTTLRALQASHGGMIINVTH